MNHDGNQPATADTDDLTIVVDEFAEVVRQFWRGSLGRTVRCVPSRRTLMAEHRGQIFYAKRYQTRLGAQLEWRWLFRLAEAGFQVAAPIGLIRSERGSMVVMTAVLGRSLDAWALTATREGWLDEWFAYLVREVAPLTRRLHRLGWVHRDWNCAHLYAVDPRQLGAPALIDVERVIRPRWRLQRWVIKDLASLYASCPSPMSARAALRFLRVYASDRSRSSRRALALCVQRKVARISGHTPRFG